MAPRITFEAELKRLQEDVEQIGMEVQALYIKLFWALSEKKENELLQIRESEHDIHVMQRNIESSCLNLITKQQPIARDLRQVTAALKAVNDISRIGDQCADIAELLLRMHMKELADFSEHLSDMIARTKEQLAEAIDAFIQKEDKAAAQVVEKDDLVDDLFNQVKDDLIRHLKEDRRDQRDQTSIRMSLFLFAIGFRQDYNIDMYLVSLYFDEKTNQKMESLMKQAAEQSGNADMIDKKVPPHITLTAFESRESEAVLAGILERVCFDTVQGNLMWVSVAAFFPQVLYLVPVTNRYLLELSERVCSELEKCSDTKIQQRYRPFEWLPHTTVARKLSEAEMREAFAALQTSFVPFEGAVVRIGLSTGSPKREIGYWDLCKR